MNSPNYRGEAANEQIDSTGSKWKNLSDEILHTVSQVRTTFEFSKIGYLETNDTAKRKLEILQFSTSS